MDMFDILPYQPLRFLVIRDREEFLPQLVDPTLGAFPPDACSRVESFSFSFGAHCVFNQLILVSQHTVWLPRGLGFLV